MITFVIDCFCPTNQTIISETKINDDNHNRTIQPDNDIIINDEYVELPEEKKTEDIDFLNITTENNSYLHVHPFLQFTQNTFNSNTFDTITSTNFNCSTSFQSIDLLSLIEHHRHTTKKKHHSSFSAVPPKNNSSVNDKK